MHSRHNNHTTPGARDEEAARVALRAEQDADAADALADDRARVAAARGRAAAARQTSAAAACALWPEVMSAAKQHGMSLGSPAANHCTPGGSGSQDSNCFLGPEDWFDAFFAQPGCGTDTVDFIATHKCAPTAAACCW